MKESIIKLMERRITEMERSGSMKKAVFARRWHLQALVCAIAVLSAVAILMVSTPAARASDMFINMPTGTPNFVGLGVGGYA